MDLKEIGLESLNWINLKMAVFWSVALCSLAEIY